MNAKEKPPKKPPLKRYRVFIAQVNQTCELVSARDREEAKEKGYAQWRRNHAYSSILDVEEVT